MHTENLIKREAIKRGKKTFEEKIFDEKLSSAHSTNPANSKKNELIKTD